MNEHKRQAYLKAMGVQAYYPRILLSAAKSPPHYDLTALADPVGVESSFTGINSAREIAGSNPVSSKAKAVAGVATGARRLLEEKPEQASRPQRIDNEPVAPIVSQEVAAAADSGLRFCLCYYRINENLAVIDEVPHLQQQGAAAFELLRAILLALGISDNDREISSESFDWPLAPDLPQESTRPEHARQALTGFIKQRKQRDGFSNLLVFAAQLTELLAPDLDSGEKGGAASDFRPAGEDYRLSLTHSLHAMLAHPMLKKEVWQQLQPLRLRLNPGHEDKAAV